MAIENSNGLKTTVISVLWAVLFGIVGWIATDASTSRMEMAKDIAASSLRIATLEESNRNSREALARIESVVEDIRRQMQQERRR